MPLIVLLFTLLTVLGALSPLLTFLALFQQKEWRFDRLLEHLRREGIWNQLWGKVRPTLALLFLITDIGGLWFVFHASSKESLLQTISIVLTLHGLWLTLWSGLTVLQSVLGKQRMPVWTKKAMMITGLSFVLLLIITRLTTPFLLLAPIILLIQPALVLLAWWALIPLDRHLKNKQFTHAKSTRGRWEGATVIGIAGSVGKTTTKELLKHLLTDLNPLATPEHVNTEMGVAQWMTANTSTVTDVQSPVFIIEMGAYRKGEIALMCEFVQPTIGVMTALGSDHLALFGSEEAIIDANAELLEALPADGHAFLYADNDATRALAARTLCTVTLAGEHDSAAVRAEYIEQTDSGLKLKINGHTSTVALHGLHNVGNILLAVAVAKHLGISDERIHQLLASFHPLIHTFHVRHEGSVLLVDDTYNSSRLSVHAALNWAKARTERPRVLLLSGLLETGEAEDMFLKELGQAARESVDRVIFTHDTGRAAFAEGYGKEVEVLSAKSVKVSAGSLLLCIGRMPLSFIQQLLP